MKAVPGDCEDLLTQAALAAIEAHGLESIADSVADLVIRESDRTLRRRGIHVLAGRPRWGDPS